jgi:RNA ligase (TIGR02306 family)
LSTFIVPIVTIKSVTKHPNADTLDIISFEETAWQCVDKIGIRKPGDLVVYVPIDSNVKVARPEFAFLAPRAKANGLCRIRTIRLRGEISQGLILTPPEDNVIRLYAGTNEGFEDPTVMGYYCDSVRPGVDCSYHYEVVKYEPPEEKVPPMSAGNYPGWCEKSDAERYQNYNRSIEPYLDTAFSASIKMDGTSCTVFYDAETDHIGVCSRNWEVKEFDEGANKWTEDTERPRGTNIYWQIAHKYELLTKVKEIAINYGMKRFAIQGEICGPGIQGNKMGLSEITFFAFDMYNGDIADFLPYTLFKAYCLAYQIPIVKELPLAFNTIREEVETNFKRISELKYDNGNPAEGAVYVAMIPQRVGTLGRLKFKYINPLFLLKYE